MKTYVSLYFRCFLRFFDDQIGRNHWQNKAALSILACVIQISSRIPGKIQSTRYGLIFGSDYDQRVGLLSNSDVFCCNAVLVPIIGLMNENTSSN